MAFKPLKHWPRVSRSPVDIRQFYGVPILGLDLEWDEKTGKPTILGLSDGVSAVSCPWGDGKPYLAELLRLFPNTKLVGHNVVGADREVLAGEGIPTTLEQMEDTIIYHWLVNMHLCKSSKKAALEEDEGAKRGRGFMNLGTMSSLYTDLSYWKECRESACEGPCPKHDVWGYNGTDSLAPVSALPKLQITAKLRRVDDLYPMHRELASVLSEMRGYGVYVDVPYVAQLKTEFERDKEKIRTQLSFNPDSPIQVMKHFKGLGIELENAQEQTIRDAVEELGDETVPDELVLTLEYKELGNGPDRWFAPRVWDTSGKRHGWKGFLSPDGRVHPSLGYFTSSGRMQCTGPNLQNVAKRRIDRRNCICGHLRTEHRSDPARLVIPLKSVPCTVSGCGCGNFSGVSVGKKIRRAIVAPPGHYIIRGDWCLAPGTRVLTSDLRWVPIENLQQGDKLLAFDENIGGHCVRFQESTVEKNKRLVLPSYRVLTDKGEVIASADHQWMVRRIERGRWIRYQWVKTRDLRLDDQIGYFGKPWETDRSYEAGYVSGILDGEGSLSTGSRHGHLVFAQNDNEALKQTLAFLTTRDFNFTVRNPRRPRSPKLRQVYLTGKDRPTLRALGMFRPPRLLAKAKKLWEGKRIWNGKTKKAFVTGLEYLGNHPVYATQTSSRTLIAEGFFSHNCNAENRVMLYLAGYGIPDKSIDFHGMMRDSIGLTEDEPFAVSLGGARDAAKSVSHASNYLEGLMLLTDERLRSPGIRREITKGARTVYPDWQFDGLTVTFTGVNLARRAFGSATYENRMRALDVTERYFNRYPGLRKLQQDIGNRCAMEKAVRTPLGYCTLSYGFPEERYKTAAAIWGSQPVAHISKVSLLHLWREFKAGRPMRPVLQVHDELICYVHNSVPVEQAAGWLRDAMEVGVPEMAGFHIPADITYGKIKEGVLSNWRDQVKI